MDSDERHDMEANDQTLGLILRMLDGLQKTTETGLSGVNQRLDRLNGRVAANEQLAAAVNERTSRMTCIEHAGVLAQLETDVETLKNAPKQVAQATVKTSALTGGAFAILAVALDGLWMWWSKR